MVTDFMGNQWWTIHRYKQPLLGLLLFESAIAHLLRPVNASYKRWSAYTCPPLVRGRNWANGLSWIAHTVHVTEASDGIIRVAFFGNIWYGYHFEGVFEYFHMAPMTEASDGMINSCLFWKYMIWVSYESVFWVLSDGNDVIMSHCLFGRNI